MGALGPGRRGGQHLLAEARDEAALAFDQDTERTARSTRTGLAGEHNGGRIQALPVELREHGGVVGEARGDSISSVQRFAQNLELRVACQQGGPGGRVTLCAQQGHHAFAYVAHGRSSHRFVVLSASRQA
jgi:hypothetical protein